MKTKWVIPILCGVAVSGCEDAGGPVPILPVVVSFKAKTGDVLEGGSVRFTVQAAAENGLARGILEFGDGTGKDTLRLAGNRDSTEASHVFQNPGYYITTLTIEDVAGQKAIACDSVLVYQNRPPQIINRLTGREATISRVAKRNLASDQEGDSLTITVAPVSAGLIFHLNSRGDSVIYYLADPDDNGTKQAKIAVVDQKNRTVEKIIDVVFSALDDIRGRVHDRYEGTYLASFNPSAVMQGPFTGWVSATTTAGTVNVPVDGSGTYAFPKLVPASRTLRAFITNGRDSSFVASYQIASGDQTFDIGVETNAGTGMPLGRLLSMYQIVNFRSRNGMSEPCMLDGINLRNMASNYFYYLLGRDTMLFGLNTRGLTREQQDWMVREIQARCFAHLPPGHRPLLVVGGVNDPFPVKPGFTPIDFRTRSGYAMIYADPTQTNDGQMVVWYFLGSHEYDGARIGLKGGNVAGAPYGFSLRVLVQKVGSYISGVGVLRDVYYKSRSTRAEFTQLDTPSTADMKLDWQVVLESPGDNNDVESKYFVLPQ